MSGPAGQQASHATSEFDLDILRRRDAFARLYRKRIFDLMAALDFHESELPRAIS